jgi:uncharacterized membrane protein YphA (DoxX/SURF4 family)
MKIIIKIIAVFMISWLFIVSGFNKITGFSDNVSGLQTKMLFNNLPLILSQLSMIIAIILELASPILMLYGIMMDDKHFVMAGAIGLIVFTVLANIFYHPLPKDMTAFMKNTSIVGGLLYITTL